MSGHEDFEGLAAGYALHALEPEDEQRLAAHLLTCQACSRTIADAAAVGSAFAELVVVEERPSAGLRDRILAAAAAEPRERIVSSRIPESVVWPDPFPGAARGSRGKAEMARRFNARSRILVGAMAAIIGVGVAVPVTLSVSGGHSKNVNPALAAALMVPGARLVTLTGDSRTSASAEAVVTDKSVVLVADRLPHNNRSNSTYVLWMAGGTGAPVAVATFDATEDSPVVEAVEKLPMSASEIKHIAVSHESGRKAPASPTDIVVQGTAA
jgi:hypothetical protein